MAKLIRGLIKLVVGVLGLIVLTVVGLLLYLDPNQFRGDIEQLAKDQGVPLTIDGSLGWTFWPRLGLSVEQVSIGDRVGGDGSPLLNAQHLSATVAIAPLLQKQLVIEAVDLEGVSLRLHRNDQGQGNWESLGQGMDHDDRPTGSSSVPKTAPTPLTESGAGAEPGIGAAPQLQLARLTLSDLNVDYVDQQSGTRAQLNDMQLELTDFDLNGRDFHWQQSSSVKLPDQPLLQIQTQGTAALNLAATQLTLQQAELVLMANQAPLTLKLMGDVNWDTLDININTELQPLNLQQWLTQWQVALPEMAAADALHRVGVTTRVLGEQGSWRLEDLSLQLDQTRLAGHAAMTVDGGLTLVLNGDRLDLDRYLPMPIPEAAPASARASAPAAEGKSAPAKALPNGRVVPALSSDALPLADLKDLDAQVSLSLDELVVQQLPLNDLLLKLKANAGVVSLTSLKARQGKGAFTASGQLDARRSDAKVKLDAQLQALDLNRVLKTLTGESRLSGAASGDLKLVSNGASLRDWQRQARGSLSLSTNALTLTELDIERSACELAALINKKPAPQLAWKGHTQFSQLDSSLAIEGERLMFKSVSAEVENLRLKAAGALDLSNGAFDVPMDIAFVGQADAERDCQVRDRWRNRDLPLRCEGRLDTVSARSCGPDRDRLDELLAEELKSKASDKLREKLQEKLGDQEGEAVEQLLRGLFKRK